MSAEKENIGDNRLHLEDFKRWKVPYLQDFLRKRGIKTSGTKDKLVARAFAANEFSVPVKLGRDEEAALKAKQYISLLLIDGKQLPDPFRLTDGWHCEKQGMSSWPPIFQVHIAEFLLTAEQSNVDLGKRLLNDYKEGKVNS